MSFFKEIVDEFKREIEKATAELNAQTNKQAPRPQGPPPPQRTNKADSGVIEHSGTERPKPKKQRKKAPAQQPAATGAAGATGTTRSPVEKTQVQKQPIVTGNAARQLVSSLNPQTARNAIIMSEVIGPPVSRRKKA